MNALSHPSPPRWERTSDRPNSTPLSFCDGLGRRHRWWKTAAIGAVAWVIVASPLPVSAKGPAFTRPEDAGPDFAVQGEYVGTVTAEEGPQTVALQVVALGEGRFDAAITFGGLPGAGWNGETPGRASGRREDETVVFAQDGIDIRGIWSGGAIDVVGPDGSNLGRFMKVERSSPTLGQAPPEGAIVLFDGSHTDEFPGAKMSTDGFLAVPATSKRTFGDHTLHLEFRTPFTPADRGQARGNSGVYVQSRYEAQVLDSFGLAGEANETGAIYTVRAPLVNACLPPLTWQTYDIDFTAAKYDAEGNLTAPPKMTVRLNGILVQNATPIPGATPTRAAPGKAGPEPGPLYLQDHGDPVVFRNVWVVEK